MTFSPWFLSSDVTSSDPDFGYPIDNSLRFRGGQYLQRTNLIRANEYNSTVSYWIKKAEPELGSIEYLLEGYYSGSNRSIIFNNSPAGTAYGPADTTRILTLRNNSQIGGTPGTPPLRDPSGWYHIVWLFQCGVSTGTATCYVNGVQVDTSTVTSTNNFPFFPWWNGGTVTTYTSIGRYTAGGLNLNGYLAEFHMVEDVRKPTDFGRFNSKGVWVPIEYTQGGYGENGFYLDFSNPNDIGADRSDSTNSASFTATGFELTDTTDVFYDQMGDTPTSNYSTLNPASPRRDPLFEVMRDGNLTGVSETGTWRFSLPTTVGLTSGKWYWEARCNSQTKGMVGVITPQSNLQEYPGEDDQGWSIFQGNGEVYHNGSGTAWGTTWTTGDVIGVYLDVDNGKIWYYKNGQKMTSLADPLTGASAASDNLPTDGTPLFPVIGDGSASSGAKVNMSFNFGQRGDFEYTPLAGYKAINSSNLPASTIPNGRDHFQAVLGRGEERYDIESNLREGSYSGDVYVATNSGSNYDPATLTQDTFATAQQNLFNGKIISNLSYTACGTQGIGAVMVFLPSTPITVNTSLRVYMRNYQGDATYGINGADRTAMPAIGNGGSSTYGWADLSFTGTLTELQLRDKGSSRTYVHAIEVDGEILYDKPLYSNWSDYLYTATANGLRYKDLKKTGFNSAGQPYEAFDGATQYTNSDNAAYTTTATNHIVFKPPTPITVNSSLRVWTRNYNGNATYTINDGDAQSMPFIGGTTYQNWADLNFTGELHEFSIRDSSFNAILQAIEVDGKLLVDGGILNLARATFPHGLYWIKRRDAANEHQLVMSSDVDNCVRTPDSTYQAYQDPSDASCVAWCWNASDAPTSLTAGSINADVSVNNTAGFSMGRYTGIGGTDISIEHGLSQTPELVFIKGEYNPGSVDSGFNAFFTNEMNAGQYLLLNSSASIATGAERFKSKPDNQFIYVGNGESVNNSGSDYRFFAWHSVPGYSAFGSYTGNADVDGQFIHTGFRPAFVMCKRTDGTATQWVIMDSTRSPSNPCENVLYPSTTGNEVTGLNDIDFLSNGFKMRSDREGTNFSVTYVYAAFAENPFGGSNVSPATAR